MKAKYLLFAVTILLSISLNAQKKTKTNKPLSIYTQTKLQNSKNSFSAINKKLKLHNFQFAYVGHFNSNLNQFPFYFEDLSATSADLVYDFKRFQDRLLPREFLIENNPTLWNLQCPNPLSVQPTE